MGRRGEGEDREADGKTDWGGGGARVAGVWGVVSHLTAENFGYPDVAVAVHCNTLRAEGLEVAVQNIARRIELVQAATGAINTDAEQAGVPDVAGVGIDT